MRLRIDHKRLETFCRAVGLDDDIAGIELCDVTRIPIRAEFEGVVYVTDVHLLTSESLLEWLQQHGGSNVMAENTVGLLLGHGHLHPTDRGPLG